MTVLSQDLPSKNSITPEKVGSRFKGALPKELKVGGVLCFLEDTIDTSWLTQHGQHQSGAKAAQHQPRSPWTTWSTLSSESWLFLAFFDPRTFWDVLIGLRSPSIFPQKPRFPPTQGISATRETSASAACPGMEVRCTWFFVHLLVLNLLHHQDFMTSHACMAYPTVNLKLRLI